MGMFPGYAQQINRNSRKNKNDIQEGFSRLLVDGETENEKIKEKEDDR